MGAAASFAGALSALPAVAKVFAGAHVEDRFAHTNFVRVSTRIRSLVCSHSLALARTSVLRILASARLSRLTQKELASRS